MLMPSQPTLHMAVLEPILSLAARSAANRRDSSAASPLSSLVQLLLVLPHRNVPAILRFALLAAGISVQPDPAPAGVPASPATPTRTSLFDRFVQDVLGSADAANDGQRFTWYMGQIVPLILEHPGTFDRLFLWTVAKNGHLHTVEWLHNHHDVRPVLVAHADAVLGGASRGGHLLILNYWQAQGLPVMAAFTHVVAQHVGIGGHVSVAQWWHAHHLAGRRVGVQAEAAWPLPQMQVAGQAAFDSGNVALFDWLCTTYGDRIFPSLFAGGIWMRASDLGHVSLLDWALGRSIPLPRHTDNHDLRLPRPMDLASRAGRLDVLDWWNRAPMDAREKLFLYSHRAMEAASAAGRVDVLDWWLHSGLELAFTPHAVQVAIDNGHSRVVQWWHRTCPQYKHVRFGGGRQNEHNNHLIPKHPITLAAFGQLQWIKTHCPSFDIVCAFDAAIAAARFGHVNVLEEYYPFELMYMLCSGPPEWVPSVAAQHGQLGVLQWWFRRNQDDCPDALGAYDNVGRGTTGSGMSGRVLGACRHAAVVGGHAHVLEWLLAHPMVQFDLTHDGEYVVNMRKGMVLHALKEGHVKCLDVMFSVEMVFPSITQGLDMDSLPEVSREWWSRHFPDA
ncbi:hypothetical protein BCR44DRAFT_90508 [Catenaria anguillulae PL171]|uniref:Ankyrin repeat-containing domain protein n=1 Tax=Catenaria anguillulae PL171 TaxID=765915 RepID=A0A1Y2HML1_9FUNG|nr:hypothetical protein BCR44DRAFT_90508 [Catenaria anguillulae PL171]